MSTNSGLSRRAVLRGAGAAGVGAVGLAVAAGQPALAASSASPAPSASSTPSAPSSPPPPASGTPQMTVNQNSPRAYQGQIYFTGPGAEIAAPDGTPLWYSGGQDLTADFQVQTYQGRPVLTLFQTNPTAPGADVVTTLSHSPVTSTGGSGVYVPDLHEFRITPQNTALITAPVLIPYDLSPVGGPVDGQLIDSNCVEIDLATGDLLSVWSAAEHVALTDSYFPYSPPTGSAPVPLDGGTGGSGSGPAAYDFFHMNSISITPDDHLLISSRHCCALYKVDRRTGEVVWTLGGKSSSFAVAPDAVFGFQHHAIYEGPDTIRLFDDGSDGISVWHPSRVVWIGVDTRAMTASLANSMTKPGIQSAAMGSAQRLPNGNVFVSWGSVPELTEFSPTGEVLFDATLAQPSYRGFKFPAF